MTLNIYFYSNMKKLILFLSLLPFLATAQAPTNDSTIFAAPPITNGFSPQFRYSGGNASNARVQFYNTAIGKFTQLVTGYQFNTYIGTATAAAIAGAGISYTAGYGLNLTGTQFRVDTANILTKIWAARYQTQASALTSFIQNNTTLQSSSNFHIDGVGAFSNGAKIGWNGTYFGIWKYGDATTNSNGRFLTDGNLVTIQTAPSYNFRLNIGTTNALQINGFDNTIDLKTKVKLRTVDYGTVGNDLLIMQDDTIKKIPGSSYQTVTSQILSNNLQNFTAIIGDGDSNLAGTVLGAGGLGATNWFNIVANNIQKPSGVNNGIGESNFGSGLFGLTFTGTVTPGNNSVLITSGSSISFTAATNDIEVWYQAITSGGDIQFSYNGTPYKTIDANSANVSFLSSYDGTFTTPSATSGTYTITATGGSVTLYGLCKQLYYSKGKNANYFFRNAGSGAGFGSFSLSQINTLSGIRPNQNALHIVALGTNSIYGGSATTAAVYGTALTTYVSSILNKNGNRMLYLIPPNSPITSPPIEAYANYNALAVTICNAYAVPYLDLNTIGLVAGDYLSDGTGIHFNTSGHAKIAAAVTACLSANDISGQTPKLSESEYLDQSGSKLFATTSGTNTYIASVIPNITSYQTGQTFQIRFAIGNTGASTLNLNGLGAKTLVTAWTGNLRSGDITANNILTVVYDGTNFQIQTPPTNVFIRNQTGQQTATINVSGTMDAGSTITANSGNVVALAGSIIANGATGDVSAGRNISAVGNVTVGNGTGTKAVTIRGGSTGSADGTSIDFQNGGSTIASLGNYSALFGGGYDRRMVFQPSGAGNLDFLLHPTGTGNIIIGSTGSFSYTAKLQVTGMAGITKMYPGVVGTDSIMVHGSDGKLKVVAPTAFGTNPLTTTGDIIYSSSGSTAARLAIGGANTVLHGGTTPSYSAIVQGDVTNGYMDLSSGQSISGSKQFTNIYSPLYQFASSGFSNTVRASATQTSSWATYFPDKGGTIALTSDIPTFLQLTGSGTGAATEILVPHGLSGVSSASVVIVVARNAPAAGISYVAADATNLHIFYTVAPASGGGNLYYNVSIKP